MVNKVMLVCRLGDDPVKKEFGTTSLCEMRVVTEKNRGNTKQTEWHNVKAFGELGNTCQQYLKKGRMIFVLGELSSKTIGDKKYVDIIASEIQFL